MIGVLLFIILVGALFGFVCVLISKFIFMIQIFHKPSIAQTSEKDIKLWKIAGILWGVAAILFLFILLMEFN